MEYANRAAAARDQSWAGSTVQALAPVEEEFSGLTGWRVHARRDRTPVGGRRRSRAPKRRSAHELVEDSVAHRLPRHRPRSPSVERDGRLSEPELTGRLGEALPSSGGRSADARRAASRRCTSRSSDRSTACAGSRPSTAASPLQAALAVLGRLQAGTRTVSGLSRDEARPTGGPRCFAPRPRRAATAVADARRRTPASPTAHRTSASFHAALERLAASSTGREELVQRTTFASVEHEDLPGARASWRRPRHVDDAAGAAPPRRRRSGRWASSRSRRAEARAR